MHLVHDSIFNEKKLKHTVFIPNTDVSSFKEKPTTTSNRNVRFHIFSKNRSHLKSIKYTVTYQFEVKVSNAKIDTKVPDSLSPGQQILTIGEEFSQNYFPITQSLSDIQIKIDNGLEIPINNIQKNFDRIIRYIRINKTKKTHPAMAPNSANNFDFDGAHSSVMLSAFESDMRTNVYNGCFPIIFLDADLNPLEGDGDYLDKDGNAIEFEDGIPIAQTGLNDYWLYFEITNTERINILQPFDTVSDLKLFNFKQIELNFKMRDSLSKCFMWNSFPYTIPQLNTFKLRAVKNPELQSMFVTPPKEIKIPKTCFAPITRYKQYVTEVANLDLGAGETYELETKHLNFFKTPEYIMIFAEQLNDLYPSDNEFNLVIDKMTLSIDNKDTLVNHTLEDLYEISVDNRCELDYNNFRGLLQTQSGVLQGIGTIILLKSGKDYPATFSSGNGEQYFQLKATIKNPASNKIPRDVADDNLEGLERTVTNIRLTVLTFNSGYISLYENGNHFLTWGHFGGNLEGALTKVDTKLNAIYRNSSTYL